MQKSSMALATVVAAMALCAGEGAWGASFQTLYSFNGTTDGIYPLTFMAAGGTLYGTTARGASGGTIFKFTSTGVENVLGHGLVPNSLVAFDGYLFGTTFSGGYSGSHICAGTEGCGTLYGLVPSTGRTRIVTTFQVDNHGISPGGYHPTSLLVLGGTLYGAVASGGAYGEGAVFAIHNGVEQVIYSFQGGTDGGDPGGLVRIGATIYGVTSSGGGAGCTTGSCGTIFKLTPDGTETVLHAFNGGSDGAEPGSLVNGGGELYAVVGTGGAAGFGGIIKLKGGKLQMVYAFKGNSDGAYPSGLIKIGDTLYGTTYAGGTSSDGTLFALTRSGHETVLHTFSGNDGAIPGSLVNLNGTIYGLTSTGGSANAGTVFSFSP